MTCRTLLFSAVLSASALSPAFAGPRGDLEFTVEEQSLIEALARQNAEYLAHSWVPERYSLEVREEGQWIRAKGVFRLTARLRSDGGPSSTASRVRSPVRVDLHLGEARCPTTIVLRRQHPSQIRLLLNDVQVVEGDEGAFDVTWKGVVTARSGGGGWQGLRALGHKVRMDFLIDGTAFGASIQRAVESGVELLKETQSESDEAHPRRSRAPHGDPTGINSYLLPANSPLSADEQEQQLEMARLYVSGGDLSRAQVALSRARERAGAAALQLALTAKQWIQGKILSYSQQTRDRDPQGVRDIVELYREGWTLSSSIPLDLAQTYLKLGLEQKALQALETARSRDPRLATNPEFLETWDAASR